ncbi:Peptidoglycan/LPS O-acetylase OafA/YrhL, contains acyltransferase and SGNH-hydrolase domains [Duganella sp. CF402]|uniref:acyltransferase family protein n=1 Tax=unclassified Duganella TaxID=2636909 RepID=UPI0008B05B0B|nr:MULTISPECIES: acyltransferase [unclassified Duganella]RZT04597.1 peptidoglycan/LPS O-acetylase OafA/YrhL [Duganella sp. BK701]SEM30811.1 Peptidoglycan/LPS O-acetylase OafA/YrhL, contains acyltransferase and SGNH-hydrolase domains [Duganella sp. CF402]
MTQLTHKHLPYLDGWRGVAIFAVLIAHFFQLRGINLGRVGVELFFVLSGRLMAQILFIKGTSLSQFYLRRFSRIYPALLVFVLGYLGYAGWIQERHQQPELIAGTLLFYTNYLSALYGENIPELAHVWSLSIEEHSYILLSLVTVCFARTRRYALPVVSMLALAAIVNGAWQTYALHGNYYQVYWRSDVRVSSILMSAALCMHFHRHPPRISGRWLLALLLGGAVLNLNPIPDVIKYSLGTLCLAIVVNRAEDLPPLILKVLSLPPLTGLGVASYSIYLWQQPFFLATEAGHNRLLMLLCALGMGYASYYAIEKPARIWINALRLPRRVTVTSK